MTERRWHTASDGAIVVNGAIPTLSPSAAAGFGAGAWRWRDDARHAARALRLLPSWLLGIIHVESRGNPAAVSPAGALGLMQLLSKEARAGLSDAELFHGPTNIRAGAAYVARISRPGEGLPQVASKFNAGQLSSMQPHPSDRSPWGMREAPGYIDAVVAAHNYALARLAVDAPAEPQKPLPLLALGIAGLCLLHRWT